VWRSASNDDTKTHDRVGASPKSGLGDKRKLERAGHANQGVRGAGGFENANGPGDETIGDLVVPGTGNNDDGQAVSVNDDVG
jgi:hypothetical protein